MDGLPLVLNRAGLRSRRPPRQVAAVVLCVLGCVAASAAVLRDPLTAVVAKGLADPFLHSTSAGAALVLLLGAALALLMLFVRPDAGPHAPASLAWAGGVLLAVMGTGNLLNLAAHAASLHSLDMPLSVPVYHWVGDTNTYSYLYHSHAGKAALATLSAGWAGAWVPSYDLGGGLARSLPAWAAPGCALALVAATVLAAWLLPAVHRRWRDPWLTALYLLCATGVVKSIADGGPLSYRFMPLFAALTVLLACAAGVRLAAWRLPLVALAAAGAAGLAGWHGSGDEASTEVWMAWAATLALIGWIALSSPVVVSALRRRKSWAIATARRACGAGLAASVAASLLATPVALLLPLPAGARITRCDLLTLACSQRLAVDESAFDAYRRAGDDPLKPHHTFITEPGDAGGRQLLVVVRPGRVVAPRTGGPASDAAAQDAVASAPPLRATAHAALPSSPGVLMSWQGQAMLPPIFGNQSGPFSQSNYYVFLHLGAATLRAQGLHSFTLAPLRGPSDARRFGLR